MLVVIQIGPFFVAVEYPVRTFFLSLFKLVPVAGGILGDFIRAISAYLGHLEFVSQSVLDPITRLIDRNDPRISTAATGMVISQERDNASFIREALLEPHFGYIGNKLQAPNEI